MVFIFFLLQIPDRPNTKISFKNKLRQLNALGLLTLLPGVVCLCLALQWGGTTYAVSFGPRFSFTAPFFLPRVSRSDRI
jgi:hypothetical protein